MYNINKNSYQEETCNISQLLCFIKSKYSKLIHPAKKGEAMQADDSKLIKGVNNYDNYYLNQRGDK